MKTVTMEEMRAWIIEHHLERFVQELNLDHSREGAEAAIEWVYDMHFLTNEEFRMKHLAETK